jgi:hypothetical protein
MHNNFYFIFFVEHAKHEEPCSMIQCRTMQGTKGQAEMSAGQSSMGMRGTLISVSSTSVGAHHGSHWPTIAAVFKMGLKVFAGV